MHITTRVVTVGDMTEQDKENFVKWSYEYRATNLMDVNVLSYPRTIMLIAEDEDGPILFVTVQPVLLLDSLTPRPETSPRKKALALYKISELLKQVSKDSNIPEEYLFTQDTAYAKTVMRHGGFEELEDHKILRRKPRNKEA